MSTTVRKIRLQLTHPVQFQVKGETWIRNAKTTQLILSLERGQVNAYRQRPVRLLPAGRRPASVTNITTSREAINQLVSEITDQLFEQQNRPDWSCGERSWNRTALYRQVTELLCQELGAAYAAEHGQLLDLKGIDRIALGVQIAAYPIVRQLREAGHAPPRQLPAVLSRPFRQENLKAAVELSLGHSGRALVRAVGESLTRLGRPCLEFDPWALATLVKGRAGPDQLRRLVQAHPPEAAARPGLEPRAPELLAVRRLLAHYPLPRQLTLVESCLITADSGIWRFLVDAAQMFSQGAGQLPVPPQPRSCRELHDMLLRDYRRLDPPEAAAFAPGRRGRPAWHAGNIDQPLVPAPPPKNYAFQPPPLFQTLDGQVIPTREGELTVWVARDRATLVNWGNAMGNCIASYGAAAKRGQTVLLGLFGDGQLRYNLEIKDAWNNRRPGQFQGRFNDRVRAAGFDILNWLYQHGYLRGDDAERQSQLYRTLALDPFPGD